jgi:hypothetical protein
MKARKWFKFIKLMIIFLFVTNVCLEIGLFFLSFDEASFSAVLAWSLALVYALLFFREEEITYKLMTIIEQALK